MKSSGRLILQQRRILASRRHQRPFAAMSSAAASRLGPVSEAIERKLTEEFAPTHLEVRNESHMHNVPTGSETHFKVVVVSEKFRSARTPISRHRLVNAALREEVASDGPVHALSIVAMTPDKWQERVDSGNDSIGPSPNCRGGDGSLPPKRG